MHAPRWLADDVHDRCPAGAVRAPAPIAQSPDADVRRMWMADPRMGCDAVNEPWWFWVTGAVLVMLPFFVDQLSRLVLAVTKAMLRRRVRRGTQSAEEVTAIIAALDEFDAALNRKRPVMEGPEDCPGCSPSLRPACRATTDGCVYGREERSRP